MSAPREPIDLRSDTMTRPTAAMREAMASAPVGDDVWNEDPTVQRLEAAVAELLAFEAGLFVPSGTMANQLALLVHCERGDEVLGPWGCHVANYEGGAAAALAGAHVTEIGSTGLVAADTYEAHIRPEDIHAPRTRLLWLENTHNRGGGRLMPHDELQRTVALARRRDLRTHLDGARLLNAQVASGRSAAELVEGIDSTSICLSKGLGAPVGSVLAGNRAFIESARRWRKRLGGGMRQVGILAAAGLYALEHHVARLAQDHENAKLLAEGFAAQEGVELVASPETNIVIVEIGASTSTILERCAAEGLLLCPFGAGRLRAVTHLDVDTADCQRAVEIFARALAA